MLPVLAHGGKVNFLKRGGRSSLKNVLRVQRVFTIFSFPLCPFLFLSVALFWSCDILCFMASVVSATVS